MSARIRWRGDRLRAEKVKRLVDALTEIDLRIEGEAKRELYPGHGKKTGTLQRAIVGEPARIEGDKVKGRVAVKGVRYAKKMHKRYRYIVIGLERVRPQAQAIIKKHLDR